MAEFPQRTVVQSSPEAGLPAAGSDLAGSNLASEDIQTFSAVRPNMCALFRMDTAHAQCYMIPHPLCT